MKALKAGSTINIWCNKKEEAETQKEEQHGQSNGPKNPLCSYFLSNTSLKTLQSSKQGGTTTEMHDDSLGKNFF